MIQINVTGCEEQSVEFSSQTAALLFLTDLREEHDSFIKTLVEPMQVANPEDVPVYMSLLRHASKEHQLKIEIIDMTGLI